MRTPLFDVMVMGSSNSIAAKRYAICAKTQNDIEIVEPKAHGLGYFHPPRDSPEGWKQEPPKWSNLRTLAVLPFRELSENAAEESCGIGMTDSIIARLTTLQNLAVRPTSSVLQFRTNPIDPTRAAQELGVESVLDGTYQRVGDTMRVSVQLIEQKDQATRWAEHYDLKTKDLLNSRMRSQGK